MTAHRFLTHAFLLIVVFALAMAVVIGGQLYPPSELGRVASLPTLNEARAKLLGLLQAPMSQFVRTIAEPQAKFARLLAAYRDRQGGA